MNDNAEHYYNCIWCTVVKIEAALQEKYISASTVRNIILDAEDIMKDADLLLAEVERAGGVINNE